jgi:hypothetical protein
MLQENVGNNIEVSETCTCDIEARHGGPVGLVCRRCGLQTLGCPRQDGQVQGQGWHTGEVSRLPEQHTGARGKGLGDGGQAVGMARCGCVWRGGSWGGGGGQRTNAESSTYFADEVRRRTLTLTANPSTNATPGTKTASPTPTPLTTCCHNKGPGSHTFVRGARANRG